MNLKLETEFSKAPILQEIDALKKQIDSMRPLPPDVEGRVMQKLRLDWNYNSNAIEGNKLSYGETVAFLMEGITAKGKPLKDHLDIRGHNEAINFLLDMVKDDRPLSEADIRGLHEMILVEPYDVSAQTAEGMPTKKRIIPGIYKTTANHVQTATGETHYYATPEETPAKMRELMEWYYEADNNTEIHPVVVAALFHHKFVAIHPFDDGNGRLSRILMNLVLLKKGYPPVVVKMDDRRNYYSLLSRADVGESWPFVEYIVELLQWSLKLYLKGAKGESIDEENDVDKKIALFKKEIEGSLHLDEERTTFKIKKIIGEELISMFWKIMEKISPFNDLFLETSVTIEFFYNNELGQSKKKDSVDFTQRIIDHIKDNGSHREFLNRQNLPAILDFVNTKNSEFSKILFIVNHADFKNSANMFSIENIIKVEFYRYNYHFYINDVPFAGRLYSEEMTEKGKQKILDVFVDDLMRSIQFMRDKNLK
jgi:Fic family protein